jgi:hypothetical protein
MHRSLLLPLPLNSSLNLADVLADVLWCAGAQLGGVQEADEDARAL